MRDVLIGQTDYTVLVKILGTDGAPETGLAHTDIDIAYSRVETDNDVTTADVAPADLANLTAAHSDWGWEEVSSTDHPGLYRLDIADAVFASGAWEAVVTITDASGTDFYPVDIGFRLVSFNVQDGVRMGLTALPNAAADAAGGLPISDAGGLDLDAKLANTNEVTTARMGALTDWINGGRLDLILDAILDDTDLIDDGTSGLAKIATDVAAVLVDTGTTLQGELDGIQADTEDIQTRLPAALTGGGNMKADALAINGATAAAARLALSAGVIIPGTVDNTAVSPTTTLFEADDITEATADHYNGRIVIFTSGALLGQATSISDYALNGGRGAFTVVALTEAPANNDTFIII